VARVLRSPVVPVAPVQVPVVRVVPAVALLVAPVARAAVSLVAQVARVVVPVAQPPVATPVVRLAVRADARTRSVVHPSVVARVDVVVEMSSLHQ
jgi:hypothetical protein